MSTTWNPADKTASVVLSGSNLTASWGAGTANQGVRTIASQTSGKSYCEITVTSGAGANSFLGMGNASAVLSNAYSTVTNVVGVYLTGGGLYMNGSNPGSLGARSDGDIIGIALDVTGGLGWFRVAPSGNWNGNASYAPGGSGGINFASIVSTGLFAILSAATFPCAFTGNFGDSAFSGAVPAGFAAGFPSAGSGGGGTTQARAMVLA